MFFRFQAWLAATPSALFAVILARTAAQVRPIDIRASGNGFAGMLAGVNMVVTLRVVFSA